MILKEILMEVIQNIKICYLVAWQQTYQKAEADVCSEILHDEWNMLTKEENVSVGKIIVL